MSHKLPAKQLKIDKQDPSQNTANQDPDNVKHAWQWQKSSEEKGIKQKQLAFSLSKFKKQDLCLLFGPVDGHLKFIRQNLNIQIQTFKDYLIFIGEKQSLYHAKRLFTYLIEILDKDPQALTPDFIKMALKLTRETEDQSIPFKNHKHKPSLNYAIKTSKKMVYGRSKNQESYMKALQNYDLVFGLGPAGTGKTYLAVAHAAQLLEKGLVGRIILSRPALEAGERLGFLPGDMKEKIDPYLRPLYDALYDMLPQEKIEHYLKQEMIEIAPLAFMRGRSLTKAVIILDEAQNTTPVQMKMFLTRLGEGSSMIITGDMSQIDLPIGQKSGLIDAFETLKNLTTIKFIHFCEKDIIRHPLVQEIIAAYNRNTC